MQVEKFPGRQGVRLRPLVLVLLGLGWPVLVSAQPQASGLRTAVSWQQPVLYPQSFALDQVLGTSMDLWVLTEQPQQAAQVRRVILAEIQRLEPLLSVWQPDSQISQLNRQLQQQDVWLHPDQFAPALCAVILACEQWQQRSQGAFNARIGARLQAWARHSALPTPAPLPAALTEPLQPEGEGWRLPQGIQWAPDGLAKGYILDQAVQAARLQVAGLRGVLLDIGGDVRAWGESPQGRGWPVGLQAPGTQADNAAPHQVVTLRDAALAFSGTGWRDQHGLSHLRDPQTGQPARHPRVAAIAPTAEQADALATTLSVLPLSEGQQLVERLRQDGITVAAQVQDPQGQLHELGDFAAWLRPAPVPPQARADGLPTQGHWQPVDTRAAADPTRWPAHYNASLTLNLPKVSGGEYHAPYVVVWVTDAQKNLVRTLHVWGNKPKWLDSNYVWWRRHGRKMDQITTIAKPSRPPGQYQISWDGLDDQGQRVPAGPYTLHIEAAREHGGHSYQSFVIDPGTGPRQQRLPAQGELGELLLNVGPRT